ncbi:MAG: S1C family serine protease, partial [Exilibacterium sp.]
SIPGHADENVTKHHAATPPAAYPTLARVTTYRQGVGKRPETPGEKVLESQAFVVEDSGFLMTSYHSLLDPADGHLLDIIKIELLSGPKTPVYADIVSVEPTLNLAILKIEVDQALVPSHILPREKIVAGKAVYAAELTHRKKTYTRGEIIRMNSKECYQESLSATMLNVDIDLNASTLGGPVFDETGAVVGIDTGYDDSVEKSQGLESHRERHILPIFLAFNIYDSIKFKQSFHSPWTGFSVRKLSTDEQALFPMRRFMGGIGIEYVWKNSPAEKLGIRKDDILVRFSYYPILSEADFQKWLYMYGVGEKVKLHLIRNRREYLVLDYTIEKRPAWAKPH